MATRRCRGASVRVAGRLAGEGDQTNRTPFGFKSPNFYELLGFGAGLAGGGGGRSTPFSFKICQAASSSPATGMGEPNRARQALAIVWKSGVLPISAHPLLLNLTVKALSGLQTTVALQQAVTVDDQLEKLVQR